MSARAVTAIVPMRHDSERIPGKNYRLLDGRPLFHYIIESLLQCPAVEAVVIDTDSDVIIEDTERSFPDVICHRRPPHLRDGHLPMNAVLQGTLQHVAGDYFLQTHSTNPLLRVETITRAVQQFFEHWPECDSLFSVTRRQCRFWSVEGRPVNHDPDVLLPTQNLEPFLEENSCMYLFSRSVFEARPNRIGQRPELFEIDPLEAIDIDEEPDFLLAADLVARYKDRQRR